MRHGSLFSGIGGFDLAAEIMGWENVFHCEWEEFPKKILKYYWPNSISYENICTTDFRVHRGNIDILTGGFPCQPFSQAGTRKGTNDSRYLWPEMLRVIREVCPSWIVGENVYGLVNWDGGLVFDTIVNDLENEGYEVLPIVLPAASVGAPHQRQRIFFIAKKANPNTNNNRQYGHGGENEKQSIDGRFNAQHDIDKMLSEGYVTNSECIRLEYCSESRQIRREKDDAGKKGNKSSLSIKTNGYGYKSFWEQFPTVSPVCNGDDGLSNRLDNITFSKWRKESIKGGGNAVVAPLILQIFKTIEKVSQF